MKGGSATEVRRKGQEWRARAEGLRMRRINEGSEGAEVRWNKMK